MKKVYVFLAFIAGLITSEVFVFAFGYVLLFKYVHEDQIDKVFLAVTLLYFFKQIYTDRKLDRISEELKTLNRTVKMSVIKNGAKTLLAEEIGNFVKSTDKNAKGK